MVVLRFAALNRWQRIWVVFSVAWTIAMAGYSIYEFPTLESEARAIDYNMLHDQMNDKELNDCESSPPADLSKIERCAEIKVFYSKTPSGETVAALDIDSNQTSAAEFDSLIWGVPVFGSLFFGYGAAWIRKGFQSR